jgi:hypothetical protein
MVQADKQAILDERAKLKADKAKLKEENLLATPTVGITLSEPEQIWCTENNLSMYTDREDKGQWIVNLQAGEGPFRVVQTYYYGVDAKFPNLPSDGYFKIEKMIDGVMHTGWVTGINSSHWKISFIAPRPLPPPPPPVTGSFIFTVTVDKVTGDATIVKA